MDVEKLIEEVRRYPVLYDLSNNKYKNNEYRERVWKKIAEDLQVEGGPITCKTKWIHIRDQFRRILKKRKTTTGMAAGPVRKYKYEDILQFILPQMSERETLSNVSQSQDEDAEGDEDDIEETQESDTLLAENDELEKTIENAERNASNDSFIPEAHTQKEKDFC
ncbi:transcription factor Adf-1-like [Photinus pyralis]|uniref:transcription factor Adf-1-like n=1 Tax=Photinus pyralis TaxID=7054 RepID=UPI001267218C|nr:transcription factor Adf-1-like [Photinus pyralis]